MVTPRLYTHTRRDISATYSDVPGEVLTRIESQIIRALLRQSVACGYDGGDVSHAFAFTKMPEVVSIHFLETRHTSTPPTSSVSVSQVSRIS